MGLTLEQTVTIKEVMERGPGYLQLAFLSDNAKLENVTV